MTTEEPEKKKSVHPDTMCKLIISLNNRIPNTDTKQCKDIKHDIALSFHFTFSRTTSLLKIRQQFFNLL